MSSVSTLAKLAGALVLLALADPACTHEAIPVEQFYKQDVFNELKISPDGNYLAATVPQEGRTLLAILRRSDLQVTGRVIPDEKTHVSDFVWVNSRRILFTMSESDGKLDRPVEVPLLFGVNVDGSGQGWIASGYTTAIISLPDNDRFAVAEIDGGRLKIDVDRGPVIAKRDVHDGPPVKNSVTSVILDNAGDMRFLLSRKNHDAGAQLYLHHEHGIRWEQINDEAVSGSIVEVMGFSADNQTAFVSVVEATGPTGVYAFDMQTRERTLVSRDDNVDPDAVLTSPVDRGVYAVRYADGRPRTAFLDPKNPCAVDLQKLQMAFPGSDVTATSFTRDGRLGVYLVWSDTNPGDYYLYDREAGKASFLLSRAAWIKPEAMSTMTPVKLTARDGLPLEGFLTLPRDTDGKQLPLVLMPHGGPIGIFDRWGFDPDVQLLANRGYAVLQINYRGSGNYGQAFEIAGYRQWGRKMQDDLTDATRWAVAQGIADPSRICIYGASYGAYAALMGVAKEPDLYRCAIGNVGVYDLPAVLANGSFGHIAVGKYLQRIIGNDGLPSISPNRLAANIKVPVLLAAGNLDTTAPPDQTKRMRDALQLASVPVDTVFYPHEGHGNYLVSNQVDWANRVLAFLDKNIGSGTARKP